MNIFLNALKWIPAAFKLIGSLVPLVKGLIEGHEVPGHGAEKKAAVLAAVGSVLDNLETPETIKKFTLWVIGFVIDSIVAIKHAAEEFLHSNSTEVQP